MEAANPSEDNRPQLKSGAEAGCTVGKRAGSEFRFSTLFGNWPSVECPNQLSDHFILGGTILIALLVCGKPQRWFPVGFREQSRRRNMVTIFLIGHRECPCAQVAEPALLDGAKFALFCKSDRQSLMRHQHIKYLSKLLHNIVKRSIMHHVDQEVFD
jgi:hypothetical protein